MQLPLTPWQGKAPMLTCPTAATSEHTWVGRVPRQEVGNLDASTLCCDGVAGNGSLADEAGLDKVEVCKGPAMSEYWHRRSCSCLQG